MRKLKKIGLVLNTDKNKAYKIAKKVINWFDEKDKNIDILIEKSAVENADKFKINNFTEKNYQATYQQMKNEIDLLILFGGDGTFLNTSHQFVGTDIPLLGINLGKLGFLTEIETNELYKTLEKLYKKKFNIEKRMLLKARVKNDDKLLKKSYALNDVVVNRGADAHLVTIRLYINDEFVNSYRADGLIIATPTGSTAYNLSAGGPIVNPQIRAIIITPICPHTLYVRPMVISENEKLKVIFSSENNDMKMNIDGKEMHDLKNEEKTLVSAADQSLSMVSFPDKTFYTILHDKMRVGLV